MPIFGDFETVGEPLAATEYRGHTVTVWRARKAGVNADPTFVVKCFAPHRTRPVAGLTEESLDKDHGLEFLEAVKQLKKAHAEGGRCLCPIHSFGFVDEGPWYVTDFYPRNTLKAWIARRGSVDSAALAQVVRCVCAAGLSLKRSRGYSHGNLKPSNIFLVGKPCPLRQTPLELADAYPAGALPMARLGDAEKRDVKELLGDVMEVQDLRALGELLLQLVEGRLVANAYDYNYPIAPAPAWERLGRDADRWRELCNQLLDPQLALAKINFEFLAREYQPSSLTVHRPKILAGAGAVCLIVVGIYVGLQFVGRARERREKANEAKFVALVAESKSALEQNDFATAIAKSGAALQLKPGSPEAAALKTQADQKFEAAYQQELTGARQALAAEKFDDAERAANRALQLKPDDQPASDLMKEAQSRRNASLTQAERDRNYQRATNAAQAALTKYDFTAAEAEASRALGYRADDPTALRLKLEAENGQVLARERAERERNYKDAMETGRAALNKKDYDKAKSEAERALGYLANDPAAQQLKLSAETGLKDAREQAERDQNYQRATNSAQVALAKSDFSTALVEANRALVNRTNDAAALTLKSAAELGQKNAREQVERDGNYARALEAGRLALRQKNYAKAISDAERALGYQANDPAALQLKAEAEAGQKEARELAERDQNYQQAMASGRAALGKSDFATALAEANRALGYRTNDAAGLRLKADAESGQKNALTLAEQERNYRQALEAAQAALTRDDYPLAITEAKRALSFRANDPAARSLITDAEARQKAVATKIQREQNYQLALTAATNALGRAEAAYQKMNYQLALTEVTNSLSQCQIARANGDAAVVLRLETEVKKRQGEIQQEQQEDKQFQNLLAEARTGLKANNLALVEQRLVAAQELIPTGALLGRKKEIKEARVEQLGVLDKEYRETSVKLKVRVEELMAAAKYGEAADLSKGSKALAELADKIKIEQPLWDNASGQFSRGNYDFITQTALSAYAQKLPFKTLLSRGQAEKDQLLGLQKMRDAKKWQEARDGFKLLPPEVQQKPPFQELSQWIAATDPSNVLQSRLNTYRVLFRVKGYKELNEFKNKTVVPMPKRRLDRTWLDAQLRAVQDLENQFRELGKLEGRTDELTAVKEAITQWND